ncbi:MAG: UbiA family prenyltransferase [Candidatus Hodarchaeales archaeon]
MTGRRKTANPDYILSMNFFAIRPFFILSIATVAIFSGILGMTEELLGSNDLNMLLVQILLAIMIAMLLDGGINILNIALDELEDRIQGKVTALTMNYLSKQNALVITGVLWIVALFISLLSDSILSFVFALLAILSGLFYQDSILTKKITGYRAKDHYILSALAIWVGYFAVSLSVTSFLGQITLKGFVFAILVGCYQLSLAMVKDIEDLTKGSEIGKKTLFLKFGMKRGYQIFLVSLVLPILIGSLALFIDGIDLSSLFILFITGCYGIFLAMKKSHLIVLMLRNGIITAVGMVYLIEILLLNSSTLVMLQFTLIVTISCVAISLLLYESLENKGYMNFEKIKTQWTDYALQREYKGITTYIESNLSLEQLMKRFQNLAEIVEIFTDEYLRELDRRILLCSEIFQNSFTGSLNEIMEETIKIKELRRLGKMSSTEWNQSPIWPAGEYLANWTSPASIYCKKFVIDYFNKNIDENNPAKTVVDLVGHNADIPLELARKGYIVSVYTENSHQEKLCQELARREKLNYKVMNNDSQMDSLEKESVDCVLLINVFSSTIKFETLLKKGIEILKHDGTMVIVAEADSLTVGNLQFSSFDELQKLIQDGETRLEISGFDFEAAQWSNFAFNKIVKNCYLVAVKKSHL